jgi:putative ABC transport system permease protein
VGRPGWAVGLLLASVAACRIPPLDGLPVGGYLAVACLLAGGVLLLPALAVGIARLLPKGGPVPARLAAARLAAAPGHAVVAAAGVLVSVALAAAMAIMVASFRDSVDDWLAQLLPADLYLRAGKASGSGHLDEALQARIAATRGGHGELHPPRQPAPGGRAGAGGADRPAPVARRARAALVGGPVAGEGRRCGSPRRWWTSTAGSPATR